MAAAYEPPVSDDRGPLVIRPSWRSLGRWELHTAALIVLAFALASLRLIGRYHNIGTIVLMTAVFIVIFVFYGSYQVIHMLGSRITVTADSILITHWFRSTASVRCSDIARVVRISVESDRKSFARPAVFAFSATGRCVLSLYAERWSKDDLDRIWRHLGITPEGSWDRTILEAFLGTEFPGAF